MKYICFPFASRQLLPSTRVLSAQQCVTAAFRYPQNITQQQSYVHVEGLAPSNLHQQSQCLRWLQRL